MALGRKVTKWIIGGVVVVVIVAVGVPFVYIHFIEGKAPAPLRLSNSTTTVAGAASTASPATTAAGGSSSGSSGSSSSSVDGTWSVASGSQAGYRIKETLFGQSNTAVGRTSAITGSITIAGTTVTAGTFSADMTKVSSDQSERDGQFQGRIMNTSKYPTATFKLTQPIALGAIPADGTTVTANATGDLTLHGTTKSVTLAVQAKRSGATISVAGSIPVVFADYGVNNPSGGPATTSDNGTMEFLINFSHA